MIRIKVGGRELALAFTLGAMDEIERRTETKIDLRDVKQTIIDATGDRHKLVSILTAMAAEGAALENREPDVDEAWLTHHMRPGLLPKMQVAMFEAVAEGMSMETADEDGDEEIDLVLEELKKKQGTDE